MREGKSSSPSDRRDASDWLRPSAHRSTLASLRLSPTRENEIVEELSQHLEDRWEELVAGGAPLCGSSIARHYTVVATGTRRRHAKGASIKAATQDLRAPPAQYAIDRRAADCEASPLSART